MSLSVGSIPAPHASNGFHERYREALAAYISGSTADAELAYAIGRTALNEHRRLPDLLSVHHLALTAIIGKSPPFAARDDVLGKAGEFLTQVAAQFEVAHRGSPDAADHVHHLSEPLERQVAERTAALRDSEQRFQDMAEVSGDWMWETDREHRFARLFGHRIDSLPVRPEPLIGRTRWEAAAADSTNDDVWARHKADLDAHRPFRRFRYEIRSPDGRPMHVSASGKPFFDANGNFLGHRGTATDETAIVEAGHRVDEAEGLLRRVFETSLDLIVVTDSYGKLVRVSPSAKLLLGYDPEEMIGGSGVEFIYPEDLERTRDQMRAARRTGNPQSFECRYVHREGRTVTFWWQGIWSAAERQYFFSGRDITDRKRAERLQAYYAAIVESTADAIIATDLDGGVTSWNKAAELIFSYSASR
jgi:PAS domain S-box-containing protein